MSLRSGMTAILAGLALGALVGAGAASAQDTRVFVDDAGREVTIPVSPQRIVSMDAERLTPSLVEVGASLVGSPARTNPLAFGERPFFITMHDAMNFRVENTDIAVVGLQQPGGGIDMEAVAATRPDLIIAETDDMAVLEQLERIAPTVLLNPNGPAEEAIDRYRKMADVAGRLDRFEELNAIWEERLGRYRAVFEGKLGDLSQIVVAQITANSDGIQLRTGDGMMSALIGELGFSYPPIAVSAGRNDMGAWSTVNLSPELLPQLQTDFLFTRAYMMFGSPTIIGDALAQFETVAPGYREFLHAARNGQHVFFDLAQSQSNTFAHREYTLDFLMATMVFRPFVPVDASAPRVPSRAN